MPLLFLHVYRACPALRLHLRACIPGYELADILADVIFPTPYYIIDALCMPEAYSPLPIHFAIITGALLLKKTNGNILTFPIYRLSS